MIEVENIKKSFDGTPVLKGISAVMETGKTNLIIGASGSGKTVFMKCIIGLIKIDEGSVKYQDKELYNLSDTELKELRGRIGMLFQGNALFDSQNVEENIMFPLRMFTDLRYKERKKKVNEVLDRVNLKDVNKKLPSEISGGMKKRVALARAIVLNPDYLFCDEPNSGLDPKTSMVIDKLIHEITVEYNMTTVINTHDMNSVMEIGDNILYLYKGHRQWQGNSKDIVYNDDEKLNSFIFASDFLQGAKRMRKKDFEARKEPS